MAVDRAALHAFITGSPRLGEYPSTLYEQVEKWRQALLAECRARKVTCALTGRLEPASHDRPTSLLADVAAQLGERWPDPTRADGRTWTLPAALEQIRLCCVALDAADAATTPSSPSSSGGSTPSTGPSGGPSTGWRRLPVLTSKAATSERSSFQSAVPSWSDDGMVVALPARGDRSNTPNPTKGGDTQRCEILLAGWENLTGAQYLRFDFTLADGFPVDTDDWQAIAQLKNSGTGSPPLELMVGRGEVYLQWHDAGGRETGREVLGKATTGVRHAVVLRVPFSNLKSVVGGWYDGREAFSAEHGPTMYPGQSTYGKLGLYRSNRVGKAATVVHHGVARGGTLAAVTG